MRGLVEWRTSRELVNEERVETAQILGLAKLRQSQALITVDPSKKVRSLSYRRPHTPKNLSYKLARDRLLLIRIKRC